MNEIAAVLRRVHNVFDVLDEEDLEAIAARCTLRDIPRGGTLFEEGDPGEYLAVIVAGKLEVRKSAPAGGRPFLVAVLGPGSTIGEFSIMDGHPRTAGAVAVEDTSLVLLAKNDLEAFTDEHPRGGARFYKALGHMLVIRLRKAMERISILS